MKPCSKPGTFLLQPLFAPALLSGGLLLSHAPGAMWRCGCISHMLIGTKLKTDCSLFFPVLSNSRKCRAHASRKTWQKSTHPNWAATDRYVAIQILLGGAGDMARCFRALAEDLGSVSAPKRQLTTIYESNSRGLWWPLLTSMHVVTHPYMQSKHKQIKTIKFNSQ